MKTAALPREGATVPQGVEFGPEALERRQAEIRAHQATIAAKRQSWIDRNLYFYRAVERLLSFVVEPGASVLNLRCQTGHLLSALKPSRGVGVDLTSEMIAEAKRHNPGFEYVVADPEGFRTGEKFDYILFSDVGDTVDVQKALKNARLACQRHTRLVVYSYNSAWQPLVELAEKWGLKVPLNQHNWLSEGDIKGLMKLSGFEWLKSYRAVALPYNIPGVSWLMNRVVSRLPLLNRLCFITVLVGRPETKPVREDQVSVSIVIPCKNEKGNIELAVQRIPAMGTRTEIIFCDDKSTDGTREEVLRVKAKYPSRDIRLVDGPGICKAKNVWSGFDAATGDVLMILDADLTVMPEELPYFFHALLENKGEFINGSRMVYPVPKAAMKTANMLGNKGFSMLFSYVLNQSIRDTLCGTKVIWRTDWPRIRKYVDTWGIVDRWGDYDLLLGSAKLGLKIVDLPVHYQERVYGTTKMIRVFQNGLVMLRIIAAGFLRLKLGF